MEHIYTYTLKKKSLYFSYLTLLHHNIGIQKYLTFCYDVWLCLNSLMMDPCGSKHVRIFGVKPSHYRPGQALMVSGVWGSQISRQSAHEGGNVFSLTHRPPLPPENTPDTHFCRGWVDPRAMVRPEGLCQWKAWMTAEVFFEHFANIFHTFLLNDFCNFQLLSSFMVTSHTLQSNSLSCAVNVKLTL